MIALFVSALAACLCGGAYHAQEPVIFNQSLELKYDRWQTTDQETISAEDANYDFVIGAPVGSYRLGAVAVLGSLGYDRETVGKRSSACTGLNRYGVRVALFPYRRFHISFDYSHQQSPSYFGVQRTKSTTYGFDYRIRNYKWPNLDFSVRHGDTNFLGGKESWNVWTMQGDQGVGRTYYTFQFFRQDMKDAVSNGAWSLDSLQARADTQLGGPWRLNSNLSAMYFEGDSSLEISSNLWGQIGPWTSSSGASIDFERGPNGSGWGLVLSQSLSRTQGAFTYFGSADAVVERASYDVATTASASSTVGALQGGAMWQFTQDWSLIGDLSLLAGQRDSLTGNSGLATSVHVGIVRGGDLPTVLRHTLFFISDLSFDRRISQEYPPGYVPAELAEQLVQRRVHQQGNLSFAADYWHSQAQGGGKQDWFRVTGTLAVSTRLNVFVIGDWKSDNGFTTPGQYEKDEDITGSAAYTWGRSSVSASLGYFKTTLDAAKTVSLGLMPGRATTFETVGFSSVFWKVPYGFLLGRYDQGDGNPVTTCSLFSNLQYGRLSFRVLYDYTKRADGWKTSRISVDLLRVFDSLVLWGLHKRH